MKFFKKYDDIYGVNENAMIAKKVLQENDIDPNNPDYIELRDNLLKKSPSYLGQFTKFMFEQDVTLEQIRQIIHFITANKGTISKLPKPVLEYTDFHELYDDLQKLDKERNARRILNSVIGDLRRELFELEPDKLQPYIDLAATISEFDEKEVKIFTKSLSRAKDLEDLIMDMELFIQKMSQDETLTKVKHKIQSTEFSKVVYEDLENSIIVARIGEFIDSYYLGSYNWCISKDGGIDSWKQYVETEGNVQYFAWDLKREKSDPLHQVGVTVKQDGIIRNCQDAQNNATDFKEFVKVYGIKTNVFVGLTKKELADKKKDAKVRQAKIVEFQAKMEAEKVKRRAERLAERREDNEWENDPMAHALREYLVDAGVMDESDDVYALEEENHDYYGLRLFAYGNAEYAIGTDEEADKAAKEYLKQVLDEIGVCGSKWMISDYIDTDAVVRDFGVDYSKVSENPESYDVEKEMKPGVEELKDNLEIEKQNLEEQLSGLKPNTIKYKKLLDQIDILDTKISGMEDTDNDMYWEYTAEKIEDKADDYNSELRDDPLQALEDRDLIRFIKRNGEERPDEKTGKFLMKYINEDDYIQYCVNEYGRGHGLSRYDGKEHEINFEGETYYIYRTN
jgi:hypothetical protein